jgi:hypothetical protein
MPEEQAAEELENTDIETELEVEEETRFDPPANDDIEAEEGPEVDEFAERASTQGWAPLDEWRGDPDKWVDAKTFVERGEQNNFMLRERNDKLFDEMKSMRETLGDLHKRNIEAEERGRKKEHDRIMTSLNAQQREAIEEADVDRFDAIENKKKETLTAFEAESVEEEKPVTDNAIPEDVQKDVTKWIDDNPWYTKDAALNMEAQGVHMRLQREEPNLTVAENLAKVGEEIAKRYPDQFGVKKEEEPSTKSRKKHIQKPPAAVHNGAAGSKEKGYNDLPLDARKLCDKYVKQIPGYTKEEYIKDYFGA